MVENIDNREKVEEIDGTDKEEKIVPKIGYARVSTKEQNLERQTRQLRKYGCKTIFVEKVSGRKLDRVELQKMLDSLQEGDEVVVTELTRISRSFRDLYNLIDILRSKGVTLKSLREDWLNIEDGNPNSKLFLGLMALISEFEVNLSKQRQAEGIAIAKEKGLYKGRVKKFKPDRVKHAIELYETGNYTVKQIEEVTGISRATFYRRLKEYQEEKGLKS